jgi:two-component system, NarL family, nitrate/nitrite response regulator NarL
VPEQACFSVFLADDHPLFLDGIAEAVEARPDLRLAGCAADGRRAAAAICELWPDVALLDMRLPELNGEEILRIAQREAVPTRTVFLSAHVDCDLVYRVLAGGAAGYLSKSSDREEVCEAVVAAGRGEVVLSADVQARIALAIQERDGPPERGLTPRESTVLALAAEGCSTREIATRLGVASATVKTHLRSAYHKLDVRDRASAVAAAMRRGLLA